jgi:hypothetical protein
MTPAQSNARLILYILAAVLASLVGDFPTMDTATQHQWIGMFLKASLAGVVAGRAYIDKSPSEVQKP